MYDHFKTSSIPPISERNCLRNHVWLPESGFLALGSQFVFVFKKKAPFLTHLLKVLCKLKMNSAYILRDPFLKS